MSKILSITLFSIVLASHLIAGKSDYKRGDWITGEVICISDGDTVTIKIHQKEIGIRFYGVDAPETAKRNAPEQPFASDARDFVYKLLSGKEVAVRMKGETTWSREVGEVFIDGQSVSRLLAKDRLAWWNKQFSRYDSDIQKLHSKAKEEQRGLWSESKPIAPWKWRDMHE